LNALVLGELVEGKVPICKDIINGSIPTIIEQSLFGANSPHFRLQACCGKGLTRMCLNLRLTWEVMQGGGLTWLWNTTIFLEEEINKVNPLINKRG